MKIGAQVGVNLSGRSSAEREADVTGFVYSAGAWLAIVKDGFARDEMATETGMCTSCWESLIK